MTNPAATQNKEIDCLSPEAQRLAEARLAAKRAARAEARDIRMKELERQQKEIYQVQKKYYGLDTKWGDIERWMEDSERYSRGPRRNTSASDEDERASVGSRGSLRNSSCSGDGRPSTLCSSREEKSRLSCCDLGLPRGGLAPKAPSAQDGSRPSYLYSSARPDGSDREPVLADGSLGGARRGSACSSHAPSEHSGHRNPSSRTSSRASSARASPVVSVPLPLPPPTPHPHVSVLQEEPSTCQSLSTGSGSRASPGSVPGLSEYRIRKQPCHVENVPVQWYPHCFAKFLRDRGGDEQGAGRWRLTGRSSCEPWGKVSPCASLGCFL
ncbi:leucine-rich repeat flightless-interacting protein 1 isoform X14 [Pteropus vampyrus]|uniref:Leucine-rich repeat flightless-interacting protein 1 isoform X14 n=1 Tax=Pteropus vampyrus TaxID=132908 RepID=A0A6P6C1K3_PTEVA|nr:leucine-rich repeat flightless-interacting protein 1 isoform X14 [Pteropus vampyrus]